MRRYDEEMERLTPASGERAPGRKWRRSAGGAVADDLPALRPRDVGEVLDVATDLLKKRFPVCVGLAFVLWLPGQTLRMDIAARGGDAVQLQVGFIVMILIAIVESMLAAAAVAVIAYAALQGRRVPLRTVLARLLARIPAVFGVTALSTTLLVLGLIACIVPGVFFWWRMLFAQVVTVLEGCNPVVAMKRSWSLTRAGFLRWLGIFAVTTFYMAPFTIGAAMFDDGKGQAFLADWIPIATPGFIHFLAIVLSSFLLAVPGAFSGIVVTVFYVDARVTREGYDLSMRLERIEAAHDVPPAGGAALSPRGGLA